ncbi:hypothetical protein CFC21_047903 [Triticum aestivum]|uniref:Uncharacterized protein n=2 Tax=Triticum aestivum TaxID=4565 RepID=A0A3B6U9J6_WHEAT|nr:hypothetical protein CFC21_047903 [Triticum aestivum]
MSRRRRRHPLSPAAAPLDDDDLLSEILLRLPPQPSSLPRASLVCRRWRLLVSDPRFARRFRIHHRRNPPLLGFFDEGFRDISFVPTLEPHNRVPPGRFSLKFDGGGRFVPLGCRHGLVLVYHAFWKQILVWDPVTTDQHRIAVPPGFASDKGFILITAAVLRASGDVHFQVALAVVDREHRRALACVYSSETGEWSDIIWTPLPSEASAGNLFFTERPAVLVGHSLYWLLVGNMIGFLEFDLKRQSLTMIRIPVDLFTKGTFDICAMRAEDGGLGFLFLLHTDHSIQLWKRRTECHGAASWVLGRTIELDKLIPLNLVDKWPFMILGFAEDNNVVFLWTSGVFFMIHLGSLQFKQLSEAEDNNVVFLWTSGVFFMIHLGSLQFKQLSEAEFIFYCHPFESVYTAARRWAAIGLL